MANVNKHIDTNDEWVVDSVSGKVVGIVARNDGFPQTEQNLVFSETNPLTGGIIKTLWVGTQAEYDAIATKDANTQYNIVAA